MKTKRHFGRLFIIAFNILAIIMLSFSLAQAAKLKIGLVVPLSGPGAPWGQGFQQGLEMAVEDFEKDGLIIKGQKYQLEIIAYDDKYSATEAAKSATRLVSVDKVKFIIGPVGSACALAMLPITEKAKVLVLGNGYSSKVVSPQFTYYFRVTGTNVENTPTLIPYVVNKYKVKTVAIIGPNDESGQDLTANDVEHYNRLGVKILYNEFYERAQQDFYPQLSKIVSLKPDLLDTSASSPASQGLIAKQIRDMGYKGPIVTPCGYTAAPAVRVGGPAVDGTYYAGLELKNPIYYDVLAPRFQKKYGKELDNAGVIMFYVTSKLLLDTIQKAQSIDPTIIKTALENMGTVNTMIGPLSWTGKEYYGINHQILCPPDIFVVSEGKEKTILRAERGFKTK